MSDYADLPGSATYTAAAVAPETWRIVGVDGSPMRQKPAPATPKPENRMRPLGAALAVAACIAGACYLALHGHPALAFFALLVSGTGAEIAKGGKS